MGIFSMPDGWDAGSSSDDTGTLFGIDSGFGLGNGYSWASSDTSSITPTSAGLSMNDLQSGSINFDWTKAFGDTLSALVAVDSINHGLPTQATQGYYKAANGQVYPVGSGPTIGLPTSGTGGMLLILLVLAAVVLVAREE